MVILKWLQSAVSSARPEMIQAAAGHGADEKKKTGGDNSVDLVNAALVDHAEDLEDLLNFGSPRIDRKNLKRKVKRKVERVLADEFKDSELIEEITERIADAAEIDPFYKRLFCRDSD